MTQPIVIAFHADGTIEYTRNPHFTPFGGQGIMERVSDIHKSPYGPYYYILWMLGPWKGCIHTRTIARNYFNPDDLKELESRGECPKFSPEHMRPEEPMSFDSYEAAVKHEIVMLNAMRHAGVKFHEQEKTTTA